jgi:hypothetical protein
MTCICPTCGQSMNVGRAPIEGLTSAPLSHHERVMVEALIRAYPRALHRDAAIAALYADEPTGGPDDAEGVMKHVMWRLRLKLPQYGWTVPSSRNGRGHYGTYKLEPLP